MFKKLLGVFVILVFSAGIACASEAAKPVKAPEAEKKTAAEAPVKAAKTAENAKPAKNPVVLMETNMGIVKMELFINEAPISVKNFLDYVSSEFYSGTVFHRIIPNFMIQGGGFTDNNGLKQKATKSPIKNEAFNGLKNDRGTLAMARTGVVDSATAQFFINVVNNDFLNHREKSPQGFGYAVFGKVIEGMSVVDKIAAVKTVTKGFPDVPEKPVVIISIKEVK